MMNRERTILVIVDIQARLSRVMHDRETLLDRVIRLIKGIRTLGIPIIWLEQYPEGLGGTVREIAAELVGMEPVVKNCFSGWGADEFRGLLSEYRPESILVCGIETHVCVYQTVMDLLSAGYHVEIVADAVSSRSVFNRDLALRRMESAGAPLTTVEMALFELQKVAEGDTFRRILKIIK